MMFRLKTRRLSKEVQKYNKFLKNFSSKNIAITTLDVIGGPHCVWLYRSEGLSYTLAPFTGRSDYGPFIAEGTNIPGMHP